MKIVISEIPDEGIDLELAENITVTEIRITSPVKGFLKITKVKTEVMAQGAIDTNVELQCSRCLKNFILPLKNSISVVYHPVEEIISEEAHALKDDELEIGFYRSSVFDTDDLIREQILLALPMKPLCSSDCKGLCSKCGTDLNLVKCNCETKEIDLRLAVLKQLLDKKE